MNIITTEEEALQALEKIQTADVLAIDTETTPILPGKVPDLVGISVSAGFPTYSSSYYFPFGHRPLAKGFVQPVNLPRELLDTISYTFVRFEGPEVFHNLYFDFQVLRKAGVDLGDNLHCTLIYSYMADENDRHGLDYLGTKLFGEQATLNQKKIKEMAPAVDFDYSRIPIELLGPYACEDVDVTLKLFHYYREELIKQNLWELAPREIRYSRTLCQVRERGVGVHVEACQVLAQTARARQAAIRAELGFDPAKQNELAERLFAPQPLGLGLPVVKRGSRSSSSFPHGRPSASKEVLQALDHPMIQSILEYRAHGKAESSYFRAYPILVGDDGRLHPQFNQCKMPGKDRNKEVGTVTGRLSCQEPNMQQIPRTSEEEREQGVAKAQIKQLFLPRRGYELWEIDYSQIELRLAATYGKDDNMLAAFKNGDDLHQLTADGLGISRYAGKTLNFAVLYGAGTGKVSELLKISETDAAKVLQGFWNLYPRLATVKYQSTILAEKRGWVRYWTGRKRHLAPEEAHKAFNSIVQGGAGEIIKDAMIAIHEQYPDIWMVNQVHDSLWFELPKHEAEPWLDKLGGLMLAATSQFDVPFEVNYERLN